MFSSISVSKRRWYGYDIFIDWNWNLMRYSLIRLYYLKGFLWQKRLVHYVTS